jgi:hypothetical protein
MVRLPHALDRVLELRIALDARRATHGIRCAGFVRVAGRRRDRQHAADRPDSVRLTVVIDEGLNHLGAESIVAAI